MLGSIKYCRKCGTLSLKSSRKYGPLSLKKCRKCGSLKKRKIVGNVDTPPIFKHCGQEILLPNMFFLLSIGSSFQHSLLMSLQVTFQLEKVMEEVLRQDQCPEGRGRLASHFIHAFGELVQQLETVVPIQSKKGHTDVPEQKQSKIIVQGVPTSLGYAECNVLKHTLILNLLGHPVEYQFLFLHIF